MSQRSDITTVGTTAVARARRDAIRPAMCLPATSDTGVLTIESATHLAEYGNWTKPNFAPARRRRT